MFTARTPVDIATVGKSTPKNTTLWLSRRFSIPNNGLMMAIPTPASSQVRVSFKMLPCGHIVSLSTFLMPLVFLTNNFTLPHQQSAHFTKIVGRSSCSSNGSSSTLESSASRAHLRMPSNHKSGLLCPFMYWSPSLKSNSI